MKINAVLGKMVVSKHYNKTAYNMYLQVSVENPHKSWNNRFWSQFSITKKNSPNFGKPKPSEGILQPSNTQTLKHLTPAKCTPNAKEKTRKSLDLKRLVGSKFSEKMAQNRQRQRCIENYLNSFWDPQRVEAKNDLKSSQVSTNWMDLKPSVSQLSCKPTQKGESFQSRLNVM